MIKSLLANRPSSVQTYFGGSIPVVCSNQGDDWSSSSATFVASTISSANSSLPVSPEDTATFGTSAVTISIPVRLSDIVGLPIDMFRKEASELGYDVRVVCDEGECPPLDADYQSNRVNVAVREGRVEEISFLG